MSSKDFDMFYGATPTLFEYAKQLRNNETAAEKLLWSMLQKKQLKYKFRRQDPVLYFIADFYCHTSKLIIELDGDIHKTQFQYDRSRDEELNKYGLTVLRFKNEDIFERMDIVIGTIQKYLEVT